MATRLLHVAAMFVGFASAASTPSASINAFEHCTRMNLPVERVTSRPTAYREFCDCHPGDCDMTGLPVIDLNIDALQLLDRVNREVNAGFRRTDDFEWRGKEDDWSYPSSGTGDCEDLALEKRKRLVNQGLPRAALTIGVVFHTEFKSPHAILLAETSRGTIVLDSQQNEMLCWDKAPYNYESRERPDGQWDHFNQSLWKWPPLRPR